MKIRFLVMMLVLVAVIPIEKNEQKTVGHFIAGAIGSHIIGRVVDAVISKVPKMPPPSKPKDPSMPIGGGVVGGGRMGREF